MIKKVFWMLAIALCCTMGVRAQQVAVKTNLLYWATTTPNIGVEVALNKRSTINIAANCNPWVIGKDNKIQHWFIRPEYRYWFSEKFTRLYVGVHLIGGQFEVGKYRLPGDLFPALKDNFYTGWGIGGGFSIGYNFYISPHWNLEASAGVGVAHLSYQPKGNASVTKTRCLPIPTELGISFVYLFNSKK